MFEPSLNFPDEAFHQRSRDFHEVVDDDCDGQGEDKDAGDDSAAADDSPEGGGRGLEGFASTESSAHHISIACQHHQQRITHRQWSW